MIYYSFGIVSLGAVEVAMWKPWEWASASNAGALANARDGATELSRRRVERQDVELFLAAHAERVARLAAVPVVVPVAAVRSDAVRRVGAG